MPAIIPTRLRTLRFSADLRQQDIADALHIARVTYSNYERGTRDPNPDMLTALAAFFGVSTDYLTGNTEFARSYADYSEKERYIFENLSLLNENAIDYLVSVVKHETPSAENVLKKHP